MIEALALVNSSADLPAAKTYNIEKGVVELGTVTVEKLMVIDARFGSLEDGSANSINEGDIDATFTIGDTATNLLRVIGQDVIDGATSIIVTDAAETILTAADLTRLADIQNTGPVTVSNAVVITGTTAELTAALVKVSATGVTTELRVTATTATVDFTDQPGVGALNSIAAVTSGAVTVNLTAGDEIFNFGVFSDFDGNDLTVNGGGGSDTFTMGFADAGITIGDFTAGPRTGRTDTVNDVDNVPIIAVEGSDIFKNTSALKSLSGSEGGANATDPYQNSSSDGRLLGNTIIFELTETETDGSNADLVTKLGDIGKTAFDIGDSLLFINYLTGDEDGAQVWSFTAADAGGVDATELTLLATLTNVKAYALDFTNFIA